MECNPLLLKPSTTSPGLIFAPVIAFLGISGEDGEKRFIRARALVVSALALLLTFYLYNYVLAF